MIKVGKKGFAFSGILMIGVGFFVNLVTASTIAQRLNHIAQEKVAIQEYASQNVFLYRECTLRAKAVFADNYISLKEQALRVLERVVACDEFLAIMHDSTNFQLKAIGDQGMHFNDIECSMLSDVLEHRINQELQASFGQLDNDILQLFNLFYVKRVNSLGCQMLLDKLLNQEVELMNKLVQQ